MDQFGATITNICTSIKGLAPGIGGLVLVIIGFLWMLAKDPQKKEAAVSWLTNVAVGFVIVYTAAALISWLGTNTSGFAGGTPTDSTTNNTTVTTKK